jgi:hypothetical protein
MVRRIRTTRQDIYIRLVKNAATQEGREVDNDTYIFDYQYELFSLGVVVGYANEEITSLDEDDRWSQDILKLTDLDESHPHRVPIDMINQLVLMEVNKSDLEVLDDYEEVSEVTEQEDVWPLVLRYADAGVERIDDRISGQDDFDLIGIVRDHSNPEWRERLRDVVVHPDAQNR